MATKTGLEVGMSQGVTSSANAPVVIIGGGPAGMACAWELARAGHGARGTDAACREVVVLEREAQVGGLARTLAFELPGVGVFRTDIGPHRFFSKNRYLYQMIEDILGERWTLVNRFTRFHIGGRFYLYPPQIKSVLKGLGLWRCFKVIRDIGWERFKDVFRTRTITNFEEHVVHEFGRTLAEFNMINYTEKIWGLPCREISPHWAEQRIKGLGVWALIQSILRGKAGKGDDAAAGAAQPGAVATSTGAKSLTDQFYYPAGGAGVTYETIEKTLTDRGSGAGAEAPSGRVRVERGCVVEAVEQADGKITAVRYRQKGASHTLACSHLVSTMLLTDLIGALTPGAPDPVAAAAKQLRYRSQVYVLLMIDRPQIGPDNWVYFPDAEIPFARFYEPRNFSSTMSPSGKTSLLLEHFCFENDAVWQAAETEPQALVDGDIGWLEKLGFVTPGQVLGWRIHRERNVYPIYDLQYEAPLHTVLGYVDGVPNLICAGRGGRFRYTNQDHSLEMGILAAQSIVRGTKLAVENVGAEKAYFEAGYVPGKGKENMEHGTWNMEHQKNQSTTAEKE